MSWRVRIAIGVFAVAFAAAPSLALAAGCETCCCPPPCHESAAACEVSLASAACCESAAPSVPSVAKRTVEAPGFLAAPAASGPVHVPVLHAQLPLRHGDLLRLVSPLRRSVVLRI